jgi:putative phosphoribosyl transferase
MRFAHAIVMDRPFRDRREAGRYLAGVLERFRHSEPVVLALPRGGVPVAFEVAEVLQATLDVLVVRKLGAPGHPELAMGAIGSGGAVVLNHDVLRLLKVSHETLEKEAQRESAELMRREALYRGGLPPLSVRGRSVLLIDDGLATGASMKVAVEVLRQHAPARLTVAVPIASPDACELLQTLADEVICARTPERFVALSLWYQSFEQTSDREVTELLRRRRASMNEAQRRELKASEGAARGS